MFLEGESGLHQSPNLDWPRQEPTLVGLDWVSKVKYEKSHAPSYAEVFHNAIPGGLKSLAHYWNVSSQLQDVGNN